MDRWPLSIFVFFLWGVDFKRLKSIPALEWLEICFIKQHKQYDVHIISFIAQAPSFITFVTRLTNLNHFDPHLQKPECCFASAVLPFLVWRVSYTFELEMGWQEARSPVSVWSAYSKAQ